MNRYEAELSAQTVGVKIHQADYYLDPADPWPDLDTIITNSPACIGTYRIIQALDTYDFLRLIGTPEENLKQATQFLNPEGHLIFEAPTHYDGRHNPVLCMFETYTRQPQQSKN